VAGEVLVDEATVATTNTPFEITLRRRSSRVFDPDRRRWITSLANPDMSVTAARYPAVPVDLGL